MVKPLVRLTCTLLLLCAGRAATAEDPLTVLSLNLAHGRGNSLNQVLVGRAGIHANLTRIAETLTREGAECK